MRQDLQALRGIAIILVVAYHSGAPWITGGYLGVDVFFTLSGFVITRMIMQARHTGTFTLADFIARRARRLLPAAFVTFAITTLAAPLFLTTTQMADYWQQLLGALLLSGNIALWMQSGYFEAASSMKPLLHTWSLGIEEQFYLATPLLLLVTKRERLPLVLATLAVASFGLCLFMAADHPSAAFFLLPFRAWELLLGALAALLLGGRHALPGWLATLAALIAGWQVISPSDPAHPRFSALAICLATLAIIAAEPSVLRQGVMARALGWIGNLSYSWYLIHWPVLAFATSYYLREPPEHLMLLLGFGSLLPATMLYYIVERPLRHPDTPSRYRWLTAAMVGAALLAHPAISQASDLDWKNESSPNHGLDRTCEYEGPFTPKPQCIIGGKPPATLVWGDSMAMQFVPALIENPELLAQGLQQATMSACGPTPGHSPLYTGRYGPAWARSCIEFNNSVLDYIRTTPSIRRVILSYSVTYYVEPGQKLLRSDGEEIRQGVGIAHKLLQGTVDTLRELGREVIIIAPTPSTTFEVGMCLERLLSGQRVPGRTDCNIPRDKFEYHQRYEIAVLRHVEHAPVIWPSDWLCDEDTCYTSRDGLPLYRDKAHLSYRGAKMLGQKGFPNR